MKKIHKIIYLFLGLCLSGWNCSHIKAESSSDKGSNQRSLSDSLSKEEYAKWYVKNMDMFSAVKKMDRITYNLEYVPAELMQVNQNNAENVYDGFLIFRLKIELENERDILNYPSSQFTNLNEKVHYLSFDMQRFVSLIANHKTIPCTIYNYEKNYGLKPYTEFTIGFDKAAVNSESFMVQLNDQYFGSGEINFSIDNSIINNTPKLKTKL